MHGGAEGAPVSLPSVSKMSFPVNSSPYLNSLRKRILDIVAAILALVPFVLLFPLLALLIKITSPGPVFYSRERLGQHGTVFKMLKLRTMYIGSDNKLKDLRTQNADARITPVGKFLRRTYLDEFPQFWNVLIGTMSVVGPRPEFPDLARNLEKMDGKFRNRLIAKPGVTGYTQINYPHAHNEFMALARLKYDMLYIYSSNLMMDLRIIVRTILRVVSWSGV